MKRSVALVALIGLIATQSALAGDVLDRVRHDNVVRCAAEERPGVAEYRPDGRIAGIAIDFCRAVAIAVLGRDGRVRFVVDGPVQASDVAFVPQENPPDRLIAGPVVFEEVLSVLVPLTSPAWALRDLANETVCLMIGSREQSALEATASRLGIDIVRLAFEEDVEMRDAYAVGRCRALIGPATELASLRGPMGINRLISRIVVEPLARLPIASAVSSGDREWAELVFEVTGTMAVEYGTGTTPLVTAAPNGLRPGWRDDVVAILRQMPRRAAGGGQSAVSP